MRNNGRLPPEAKSHLWSTARWVTSTHTLLIVKNYVLSVITECGRRLEAQIGTTNPADIFILVL